MPEIPPVLLLTSDLHPWALRCFAYMWNKYVSPTAPVYIYGFTPPSFSLPDNFSFDSLGDFADYPAKRWSDGWMKALDLFPHETFIFMLEDFWPIRRADVDAIRTLHGFMQAQPNILRIDLTADRLNSHNDQREIISQRYPDYATLGRIDVFSTPPIAEYRMSTMAAIWRKSLLQQILVSGESPWEVEISGSRRLNERPDLLVLGTRQFPLRHTIAIQKGKIDFFANWMWPVAPVAFEDRYYMETQGWLPDGLY